MTIANSQTLVNLQISPMPVKQTYKARVLQTKKAEANSLPDHYGLTLAVTPRSVSKVRYRTIAITSCDIVSNVVTVFEFASNAR
jgi:hypothetical protein